MRSLIVLALFFVLCSAKRIKNKGKVLGDEDFPTKIPPTEQDTTEVRLLFKGSNFLEIIMRIMNIPNERNIFVQKHNSKKRDIVAAFNAAVRESQHIDKETAISVKMTELTKYRSRWGLSMCSTQRLSPSWQTIFMTPISNWKNRRKWNCLKRFKRC
eukprot:Platyproteum_vivax@DN7187_c0_g1_i2.p1